MMIHNVRDGRQGCIRSYEVVPLIYDELRPDHVGRTVVYQDHGRAEAGTITSWRDGTVFAKYSRRYGGWRQPDKPITRGRSAMTKPALETLEREIILRTPHRSAVSALSVMIPATGCVGTYRAAGRNFLKRSERDKLER